MGRRRRTDGEQPAKPPIALEPVDLLAGLAPGLTLTTDELPPGIANTDERTPPEVTVNDIGRQIRQDEPTVRRLIRNPMLRPKSDPTDR